MQNIFHFLDNLDISYEVHEHEAVFTVAEAAKVRIETEFGENKNLFLRNPKGNKHYLVTIAAEKQLDLKALAEKLGEKRLSFASEERLKKYLDLTPGSVSPFGLLNDAEHEVIYVLDKDLFAHQHLGFHPGKNTHTLVLQTKNFQKYLEALENKKITHRL